MNRRGFLRSGVVVGMAGALLGAGASEAKADVPSMPFDGPLSLYVKPPPIPEPRTVETRLSFTNTVTMRGGYDWPSDGSPVRVVEDSFADMHVIIDGKSFRLSAYRAPEEG